MLAIKRELVIFFLVGCLVLASTPIASCRSAAPIVYVAGDGSGDFICDGTDDHVQINEALKFVADNSEYTTVHLKGPFTYVVNDTLLIGSNTILEGDSTAVIKLANNAGWKTMKPLIQQMNSAGNNNIVIRGFEVNVNHDGNIEIDKGDGYYNVIYFLYCKNVTICDMYMHDGHGDGMRIKYSEDINFYNNTIYKLGHDGLYAIQCQNVEAWNNTVTCRTNSALRIWNSNHVKFHDNVIDSFYHWSAGGPGIQIEKGGTGSGIMDDIEICNNTINNTYGPAIWLFNYDTSSATRDQGKNVHIHHNIFYDTGTNPSIDWVGGIIAGGFEDTVIENNVFDGIYHSAVTHMYINGYSSTYSPAGDGYTTIVRNNIIISTQPRTKDPNGTGYGVVNYLSGTHTFVLENNCLYNNSAGNYKDCTSTTDIYVDPLFIDLKNRDYHLQSVSGHWDGKKWVKDKASSPCIDAGYTSSDYSNEPEDNGDRINIGRYGNTIYASLSGAGPVENPNNTISGELTIFAASDNRLRETSPEAVFQNSSFTDVGGMSTGRYRDVMWFNLSECVDSTEVSNATLNLFWYYPAGSSRPEDTVIEVYRPASAWNSSYVSWNKKDKSIAWKYSGGDWYDKNNASQGNAPYASLTLKGSDLADNRYYELNVTDLVNEYISGKYENTGFFIKARTESNNYIAFYSSDCGIENQLPKLNLTKKTPVMTVNATILNAKDNRIREASPETIFHNISFIDIGGMGNVGRYRGVILFNLSGYTSATQVNSAVLSLFWYYPPSTRPKNTIIEIYRPAAWNPDYVTWNKKDKGIAWNNAGGDWYDRNGVLQGSTPYATITLRAGDLPDNRYYELDVTDLVKEYISGKYANTGFLIKASNESDNYIAFYSADCGNLSQVPKLDMIYS